MRIANPIDLVTQKNSLTFQSSNLLMKQYQVTRKRQITLPKKLADKKGIKPGDVVVFEESGDAIIVRKSSLRDRNQEDLDNIRRAIKRYSKDIPMIKKAVEQSRRALIENLSRHVSSE